MQIISGKQFVKTNHIEYAKQLEKILKTGISINELAEKINKEPEWIEEQLKLIFKEK